MLVAMCIVTDITQRVCSIENTVVNTFDMNKTPAVLLHSVDAHTTVHYMHTYKHTHTHTHLIHTHMCTHNS
jgi:hypothetical protein